MNPQKIAKQIIALKRKDFELRSDLIKRGELFNGYNKEMEALHHRNARELEAIIDKIGYPTSEKVGEEASEAAWMIIQHSIGRPNFMRKGARLLAEAVEDNMADPKHLAYLTDRIAVYEGKPQRYGTQFDWDENGQMSPRSFDNLEQVNERRKKVGLNTLDEQIAIMRKQVEIENRMPPTNLEKRQQEYNEWRRRTGWMQ